MNVGSIITELEQRQVDVTADDCGGFDEKIPRVWHLHFGSRALLDDFDFSILKAMQDLEWLLFFDQPGVGDRQIEDILPLPKLKHIGLGFTAITDAGISFIARTCNSLESIDLANTKVSDICIDHLVSCESLEIVNLSWTNISSKGLGRLLQQSSKLQDLTACGLASCQELTEVGNGWKYRSEDARFVRTR